MHQADGKGPCFCLGMHPIMVHSWERYTFAQVLARKGALMFDCIDDVSMAAVLMTRSE
jgi:hypothetical protein